MIGQLRMKIRSVPILTWVCILLLMTPPFLLLYYIKTFGVNAIFWDDWQKVALVQKAMKGTLSFSDLFAQHNEHRMLFPNLVMLTIEIFTRCNMVAVMLFSWTLICLTSLLIFHVYRKQFHWISYPKLLLIFLPVLLLLFSFRQWESILWAITSQIYLMIFAVVATFFLLEMSKKLDVWFVSSLLAAILASFSFFVGLVVWPVGLFQIIISKKARVLRRITLWCMVSTGVFISYFWGYVKPPHHPPINYILAEPVEAVRYFFAFINSPLFWDYTVTSETLGLVAALIAVSVLFYAYRRKTLRNNSVWLSLILFAALCSFIATVGRSGFGVEHALSSRYTPMTVLGAIGLYFLALSIFERPSDKSKSFGAYILLALILVWIIAAYSLGCYTGWRAGQYTKFSREMGAYILSTYKIQSNENIRKYLFCDTELVRNQAEFLEKNRLNVFSRPIVDASTLVPMHSDTLFALETINGKTTLGQTTDFVINSSQDETITIIGWALDKEANDVASTVFIIIDGGISIPVIYGLDRPDVANNFRNTNFRFSGYIATFSSSILSLGNHSVSLEIVSKDGYHYYYQNQVLSLILS